MNEVHWRELKHEVVDTGLCTGCAACVMACPRDVLGYTDDHFPVQIGEGMAHDQCVIGDRGCDICTRACPRFRAWETELDTALFDRERTADEPYGMVRSILLTRATDRAVADSGQDGGLVSTLLIWGLETGRIDGALTSKPAEVDGAFRAEPTVVTDRAGVLATAGSRYAYSANPLAMAQAEDEKLKELALVGMSCQASINGSVEARKVNKYKRRIALTLGLLCSKTFTNEGQQQVLREHGIDPSTVVKVNIKGKYQVWTRDGDFHELPLKPFHAHTRPGCKLCPDFAAEHADISCGGIGTDSDWTLTLVRTQRGEDWIRDAIDDGVIDARPGETDEVAMNLLTKLSTVSRKRWPVASFEDERLARPGLLPVVNS